MSSIASNLSNIQNEIQVCARRCARDPASIRLLAVSKTFPAGIVEEASAAGQVLFGENRVQEAISKIPAVRSEGLVWHLVGHLQSNKAHKAVEFFDVIQTIDSEKIARKLSNSCQEIGKRIQVFVQVNIGEEPQKTGFSPLRVGDIVSTLDSLPGLELVGLMSIPPFHDDPEQTRPYFKKMFSLISEINQNRQRPLTELSMGMSADFQIAIEEGATLIRLGTAIFGPREK